MSDSKFDNLNWHEKLYVMIRHRLFRDEDPYETDTCKYRVTLFVWLPMLLMAFLAWAFFFIVVSYAALDLVIALIKMPSIFSILQHIGLSCGLIVLAIIIAGISSKIINWFDNKYEILNKLISNRLDAGQNRSFISVFLRVYRDWKNKTCTKFTIGE